jgi:hypothetical protein
MQAKLLYSSFRPPDPPLLQLRDSPTRRLQDRKKAGELYYLPSATAFFDDDAHFRQIRELCSFTHPRAGPAEGGGTRTFPSMRALRAALQETAGLSFCSICLEGRKVFVAEQEVYGRRELERHLKSGDTSGALAESGFKGHPECHFCK